MYHFEAIQAAAGSIPGDDPRWREYILNEISAKEDRRTNSKDVRPSVRPHGNKSKRNKVFWSEAPPEEGRQLERRELTITCSTTNLKNASNRKVRKFSPIILEEKDGGIYDFIHLITSHYSSLAYPLITPIPYSLLSTLYSNPASLR